MPNILHIVATDGEARAGLLRTHHGDVPTPAFMPVATQGSVKAVDPFDLKGLGATILLANTYHLYLRPGIEVIRRQGGLHSFMSWDGPILTDSGGFQGYSLEHLRQIGEEGITFKSHIDGSVHLLTPEAAIDYQESLGVDIAMALDVCPPYGGGKADLDESMQITHRWAIRCLERHTNKKQALFGIIQGGSFADLRAESAEFLTSLDFPGYAIGGLSVGEPKEMMYRMAQFTTGLLPNGKPRYLMGVGSPEDLVECVARGIDLFDCALPTRIARNSALFVHTGRLNIDTAPYREQEGPIEEGCDCFTCQHFSAAYLHHLFRARELLAYRLATIHNLRFVIRLMEEMREAIFCGAFEEYRQRFHKRFIPPDETVRIIQKEKWLEAQGRPRPARPP
ncbi:MAG: tRNA guanosine(34) transglycosylase Tgt [Chloroflexi bacterium]|nr:tRNA guanosine(34) transglycosylase Tgt [Chloroflexota bacterium]